ncbi:hypothetical protein SAMN05216361_0872 [Marisediminitalea aggregata]|uniref:Uncharacterized protein n=1 Tax=Marisediminitalea aggregata TaxID=634436 RepID=A0A1M5FKR8_9ALTE|nr:hypothetical protein [Marisediminitalea aggregata]MEC7470296.1 hypothetical protein [Pseudomonadota bacterium]MEC7823770.1 hypothetical protein [Pseudomonadota bacterium]SHF91732.1 hypothetical protein SAMN05216361_0872 [Marisediminitalea aggregata]
MFTHKSRYLIASLLFASVFTASSAQAGLFSSDKKPAPWAKDSFLTNTSCSDLDLTVIRDFIGRYTPERAASKQVKAASDQVMTSYVLAALAINQANICLAESLDLKSAKESLLKEREILKSGTSMSKKEIKKHRQYAAGASEEIRKKTLASQQIGPDQQKAFILGASTYLFGTYKTYQIKEDGETLIEVVEKDAKGAKSSGFSLGGALDMATKGGDYVEATNTLNLVLKGMPKHLPKLVTTAQFFIEYANSQDLELDKDATEEFNSVSDWG